MRPTADMIGLARRCLAALVLASVLLCGCVMVVERPGEDMLLPAQPVEKHDTVVRFESTPTCAEVYIDEDFVGTTPLAIPVEPGERLIEFRLDGFSVWKRTLSVKAGVSTNVHARLLETDAPAGRASEHGNDAGKKPAARRE